MDPRISWADIVRRGKRQKTSEQSKIAQDPEMSTASRGTRGGSEVPGASRMIPEDGARMPRAAPVRILKRPPPTGSAGGSVDGSEKPPYERQPLKSLQQREAEYAAARLRILGSAYSSGPDRKTSGPGNFAAIEKRHSDRPRGPPPDNSIPPPEK